MSGAGELEREFRVTLRKQVAMQARVAREGYGRNHAATVRALEFRHERLRELVRTDAVLDACELDGALWARWCACERRYYGLPV